jgi:two-component system, chemotaxis family, response regulator WspF
MNSKFELEHTPHPLDKFHRPSIDVFFQSVALNWPHKSIAVLLTGMGSDGALGLKALREAGWHTIVEHEDSCVVYGMPKAAIKIGASTQILPLEQIPVAIISILKSEDGLHHGDS